MAASRGSRGPGRGLAGAHVGVLIGVMSVYFPDEFRAVWIFNCGVAANLLDLHRRQAAELRRSGPAPAIVVR